MFEFAILKELHQHLSASTSSHSVNSVENATADVADELVEITSEFDASTLARSVKTIQSYCHTICRHVNTIKKIEQLFS
jgi:hypothetical protein